MFGQEKEKREAAENPLGDLNDPEPQSQDPRKEPMPEPADLRYDRPYVGPDYRQDRAATSDFYSSDSERNTLNGKEGYDEHRTLFMTAAQRSQQHYDTLQSRLMESLDESLSLQKKVNGEFFTARDYSRMALARIAADRHRNDNAWDYETAYDLGNPVTTGVGDNVRAGAVPANRAADVAASGVAAGVSESVQTNVTSQIAALTVQTGELVAGLATLSGTISNFLTAQAAANAAMLAALTAIAPKA